MVQSDITQDINSIDTLLESFGRFGVDLGLERIVQLLDNLDNPQQRVPIVHVAGTNGKGSVCAYLSSILSEAGYRVGRYISPHLVSWCERFCINGQPIAPDELYQLLTCVCDAIRPDCPSPTQFEIVTAAAFLYFAQQQVDVAIMEVGLGGRLDATNVCDRPLVSVITSISREHWQRLGPTVGDIAGEKAGILKPRCPAVLGVLSPEAEVVVRQRVEQIGCEAIWVQPATDVEQGYAQYPSSPPLTYPLPLPGAHQRMNSALAIAAIESLRAQAWIISDDAILRGLSRTRWPGRIQWATWKGQPLLIDGAHNPAAATVLRQYVDDRWSQAQPQSVHWIMGMLSTKDHKDIFRALLRTGDRLSLVPVPGHSSADPRDLAQLVTTIDIDLETCRCFGTALEALDAAFETSYPGTAHHKTADQETIGNTGATLSPTRQQQSPVVLCGSLYLIGSLFQQCPQLVSQIGA